MGEQFVSMLDIATWRIFFMLAKLRLPETGVSGFFNPVWEPAGLVTASSSALRLVGLVCQ